MYGELTWAEAMAERAEGLGVPGERIVRQGRSTTTAEDAAFTAPLLQERGVRVVLVVTSAYHSGRACGWFEDALGEEVEVRSCPAPTPGLEVWWRDAALTRDVVSELLKRLWPS